MTGVAILVGVSLYVLGLRALLRRLRAARREVEALTELAVANRLRPRTGAVAASTIEAPATITSNGREANK